TDRRAAQLQSQKKHNARRADSDQMYKTSRWKKLSVAYRRQHPLCCDCESRGTIRPADLVDHIKPAKKFPELFWDWRNLRALCQECHNRIGERVTAEK
ncbi:HNH endonuclease, partial [Wenyingzhuangia sp. 1_MG-2023]|nr:HNH endonuclease [Wenyingzhuangia sp. 1_MG-2023]